MRKVVLFSALIVQSLVILFISSGTLLKHYCASVPSSSGSSSVADENENNLKDGPNFAYAFVISGCYQSSCHAYLLNILVASHILRQSGSTADVVLNVRMSSATNETKLESVYETWLEKARVKLMYLPKLHGNQDNFGLANVEKFRILEMVDYDLVFFFDADIAPLCNTDYFFEEASKEGGMLSDYVVIQGGVSPSTGSSFLMKPRKGEFGEIIKIIQRHRSRQDNPHKFHEKLGWGHEIHPNDTWVSWRKRSHLWNFYGVEADQGLLWHWVKYQQMNFSHISLGGTIETWREVTGEEEYWMNHTNVFPATENRSIAMVDRKKDALKGCGGKRYNRGQYSRTAPYSDFFHYSGWQKPWNRPILSSDIPSNETMIGDDSRLFWLYWLGQVNETWKLELPSEIVVPKGNPLGIKPGSDDLLSPSVELPTR